MQRDPVEHYNSRIPAVVNLIAPCVAITLGRHIFYRNPKERVPFWLINHEHIHAHQIREQGWWIFLRNYRANEEQAQRNQHNISFIPMCFSNHFC